MFHPGWSHFLSAIWAFEQLDAVPGFTVPVHRALTEPILLAGTLRAFAILNGTLAGAIGLGRSFGP